MNKKKIFTGGLVFSTNPDAFREEEVEEQATLPPEQQQLKVTLDSKHRAGKVVTLVSGFVGTQDDLETLGKTLKTKCGTGGSAKDAQIIIQGDYKAKVFQLLQQLKYKVKM
jgi:translation initiation factor 1